jgi:hypothetical protein
VEKPVTIVSWLFVARKQLKLNPFALSLRPAAFA